MEKELQTKDSFKEPSLAVRSGGDINFFRFPIFASKAVRGYRTLPAVVDEVDGNKITRTVSVGTYKDTGQTLDADDELVFRALYARWEKNGCNMNDRTVVTALMSATLPMLMNGADNTKMRRIGMRDYNKLRRCLDKLARVPVEFDKAYENNSGYRTETITILKSAEIFNRKEKWGQHGENGGKFFEFTKLELNENICQNIKDGKVKLFYLDQVAAIKGETGRLIYRHIELLGGVINSPFRREALGFAKECTIDIGPNGKTLPPKRVIEKMRRACKELKGKIITSGVIGDCYIEFVKDKWFFVCEIRRVITMRIKKTANGMIHVVPDRKDLQTQVIVMQDQDLEEKFNLLPVAEQSRVVERAAEIHEVKHHKMGPGYFARQEALREYFGLEALHEDVGILERRVRPREGAMRENSCVIKMDRTLAEERADRSKAFRILADAIIFYALNRADNT